MVKVGAGWNGATGSILRAVLDAGGLSRAQISRVTGLRPNTVCERVDQMIATGWLRSAGRPVRPPGAGAKRRGRPAVCVEADPEGCQVLGLAIRPERVAAVRLNLLGQPRGSLLTRQPARTESVARAAGRLARQVISDQTRAVGVCSPGLFDERQWKLLFSSAVPGSSQLSLKPILSAVDGLPIVLENDVHALGDRWRLAHPEASQETILLVWLGDGAVGASIMPAGGPADPGVVRGGNELGHMQVFPGNADIPTCYCGQPCCLERAFSSTMVRRLGTSPRSLAPLLHQWALTRDADSVGAPAEWIISRLAGAVANAVNLLRPHRVVWAPDEQLADVVPRIEQSLSSRTADRLMPVLKARVRFEHWQPRENGHEAVTAGHLALATLTGRREASEQ